VKRRQFLSFSLGAAMSSGALAQTPPPAAARPLKVDIFSRHLQWLRTADEVADAVNEMGFDGLDITVRPYPGHVDPARVAEDLPPFVKTIRSHGLQVREITCPIADADSPNAEAILSTASSLGITHYWWGTFRYAPDKPVMQQLEDLKPRVAKLAALNAKYHMTAMYHTNEGNGPVGAAIWDLLSVLRNFDPAQVGFHYDFGHMTLGGGNGTWALNLRAAGPYIAGVSVKDALMEPVDHTAAGAESGRSGRGAMPAGWRIRQVPLGEGLDNLPLLAATLKEINFTGPLEIQAEYPNGGAESAQDKLTLPRSQVLGAMKRDLTALRTAFAPAGLL
jgi:sugar phosphate isomerase/epimerase